MRRIIVDYAKLTGDILNLLVEKFPEGYDDTDIIRFRNAQNELIEAVEVRTEDTIYLVKVSTKLASRMEKFDEEDDLDSVIEPIEPIKGLDDDEDAITADEDDEEHHANQAMQAGAKDLPFVIKTLMAFVSKGMTKTSYYI